MSAARGAGARLALGLALAGAGCGGDEELPQTRSPAPDSAVVWAFGDMHAAHPDAPKVVGQAREPARGRVLYTGDVYPEGTAEDFRTNFDAVYAPLARRTLPTPGNHEWGNRAVGYYPYWSRARGVRQRPFYSVRIGGWEILSLNSESGTRPGSAQLRWLRGRLRRPGTCRIAFWHRPRFSAGTEHGDDPAVAPLWDALRGRARIVVAGHDHNLQRLRAKDGITQFVSGAGGARSYGVDREDPRLVFGADDRLGALRLELRPGEARHVFVDLEGRELDRGRIACSDAG